MLYRECDAIPIKQKKTSLNRLIFETGEERFELPLTVLETVALPLNYSPSLLTQLDVYKRQTAKSILVLPPDESVQIPDGFMETTIQLNGTYKDRKSVV